MSNIMSDDISKKIYHCSLNDEGSYAQQQKSQLALPQYIQLLLIIFKQNSTGLVRRTIPQSKPNLTSLRFTVAELCRGQSIQIPLHVNKVIRRSCHALRVLFRYCYISDQSSVISSESSNFRMSPCMRWKKALLWHDRCIWKYLSKKVLYHYLGHHSKNGDKSCNPTVQQTIFKINHNSSSAPSPKTSSAPSSVLKACSDDQSHNYNVDHSSLLPSPDSDDI